MGMAAEVPQFHVLAVDDSLIDRKLIERLLKTSSFQVTTVESGSKALEFLGWQQASSPSAVVSVSPHYYSHKEVKVNLIITDYCMPEMTGYDLLKILKESSSLRNIPVVIMSSENVPSRITRCLEEGAEEFFLKPVRLSDVNRLKPHMLRAKYGQQQQQQQQQQQDMLELDCHHKPTLLLHHHQQQQQQQEEASSEKTTEDQQVKQQQQKNNSKRKSLEDGQGRSATPDRTRPRYTTSLATQLV